MASKAQSGRGSAFSIGPVAGTSTPTYVKIGEVKSAGFSGSAWGTEDVSSFDSPVDEEFITLMRNPGEVNITYNRVSSDTGQLALDAAYDAGALYMFTLVLPKTAAQTTSGDKYSFNALVMSRDIPVEVNKAVQNSVKLKISGSPVFAAGS